MSSYDVLQKAIDEALDMQALRMAGQSVAVAYFEDKTITTDEYDQLNGYWLWRRSALDEAPSHVDEGRQEVFHGSTEADAARWRMTQAAEKQRSAAHELWLAVRDASDAGVSYTEMARLIGMPRETLWRQFNGAAKVVVVVRGSRKKESDDA